MNDEVTDEIIELIGEDAELDLIRSGEYSV